MSITPFYFKPHLFDGRTLSVSNPDDAVTESLCYGVFHEPVTHFVADHVVLFLYPWGQEYVRCHRGVRRMALALQEKGIPSLRFDYRGTGDSGGSDQEFCLRTAIADAQAALHWLVDTTGADRVKVFSVRLGCAVALQAFDDESITEIHAWDPILDGEDYLAELHGEQVTSSIQYEGVRWINGYPLNRPLEQDLQGLKVTPESNPKPLIVYVAAAKTKMLAWQEQRRQLQLPFRLLHQQPAGQPSEWGTMNKLGGFVNPSVILNDALDRLMNKRGGA